jgi:hypothetical protein
MRIGLPIDPEQINTAGPQVLRQSTVPWSAADAGVELSAEGPQFYQNSAAADRIPSNWPTTLTYTATFSKERMNYDRLVQAIKPRCRRHTHLKEFIYDSVDSRNTPIPY